MLLTPSRAREYNPPISSAGGSGASTSTDPASPMLNEKVSPRRRRAAGYARL